MATKARRRQIVATRRTDISNGSPLREDFVRAGAGLAVDREAGIIPGVKILGWDSANGRRYEPDAVNPALYEGVKVFDSHKQGERTGNEGLGVLRNIKKRSDGLYGDFHYFRTSADPLLEKIVDDAERNLGVYGLSHNVPPGAYKAHRDVKGTLIITEITRVESVDLVTNPATNRNLRESRKNTVKIKFVQLLESLSVDARLPRDTRKRLLEADMDAMPDMEVDAPAEDADPGMALKDGFKSACMPLLDAALDGDADSLKQLQEYIKSHAKMTGKMAAKKESESSMDDSSESDSEEEKEDDKEPAKESKILEPRARQLAALAGLAPDKGLLECICGMSESNAIKVLELAKGNKAGGSAAGAGSGFGAAPRSAPAGTTPGNKAAKGNGEALTEGVIPLGLDDDSRAKRLAALRGR